MKLIGIISLGLGWILLSCENNMVVADKEPAVVEQKVAETEKVTTGIDFFHGTWEEALAVAEKEDKIIFLDAYATWCGPCKRMAKNVFPQEVLASTFNENFINFKMDMEKGVGPVLSSKLKLKAYPTLFFLDHNEKVISSSVGYLNVDALLAFGKKQL